jgi:outer membrane protein assembly factor BamB
MRESFVARRVFPVTLLLTLAALIEARAGDWPTFRGIGRTAVSSETGLLQQWPSEGPPLVCDLHGAGRGYSSLAVVGGRIYTLGDGPSEVDDEDEYLLCFDAQSGKRLWATKTGPAWNSGRDPNWKSSRSTPTIDGDLLYVITPHGVLVCCETASGREKWRKDLMKDFGGVKADGWGYSESVLIDGGLALCTPGGEKSTMVALDKTTGDLKWSAVRPGDRGAGHASIVVSDIVGTRVYVQSTGSGPIGVRAGDGQLLWQYAIDRTTAVIPTPIVRGDLVFFTAGYGRGGALFRQVAGHSGEVTIEEVYSLKPALGNKHGGVVLVGDYLYGDSEDRGNPWCADFMTGEIKWKKRGSGQGSAAIAAADGRLYLHYADGTMVLARASPNEYAEVGSFKVPGSGERPSWAHPVIANGKLYVREQDRILCYDIRAK